MRAQYPKGPGLEKIENAFEDGAAGHNAVSLGLVVELHWFQVGNTHLSLHVVVTDGTDDRRLAEWWPSTKKATLWTYPPLRTRIRDSAELPEGAAQVRQQPVLGTQKRDAKKKGPRQRDLQKTPPRKLTRLERKKARRRQAKQRSRRLKSSSADPG